MLSSLPDFQKERRFPCTPSRKKNLLKFKRESTRCALEEVGNKPEEGSKQSSVSGVATVSVFLTVGFSHDR